MLDKNFIFKKFPIWPPISTAKKRGQKFKNSLNTISFVSCPATPKIEFIKINKDAVVAICFGYPAFIRNKNGLKNIPPPIPTIPETNPIKEPIKIDKIFGICFTITWFLLNDLLSINKNDIDVVITTGGTGLTGRDITPEAIEEIADKQIPGFGEVFRNISLKTVGTSAIQSRACAVLANGKYVFALPGSSGGVTDAWDGILKHQLDINHKPCNFVELFPRLKEK